MAIQILPEELADDEERLRWLEREVETLASLHHANVDLDLRDEPGRGHLLHRHGRDWDP